MKGSRADVYLAICVIVGASIYLYADALLPEMQIGGPLGPKAFPALVGAGLLLSAVLLLRETWAKRSLAQADEAAAATFGTSASDDALLADSPAADTAAATVPSVPHGSFVPVLLAMVAWTALYYFCFERVGYLIATVVFLFGLLSYFHRGHHRVNVAVALIFTLIVDLLFSHFLNVPMPAGWLSI